MPELSVATQKALQLLEGHALCVLGRLENTPRFWGCPQKANANSTRFYCSTQEATLKEENFHSSATSCFVLRVWQVIICMCAELQLAFWVFILIFDGMHYL